MSAMTATSKGTATRDAIIERAYEMARVAGVEGLSIGPLAQLFLRLFDVPPASGGSTVVAGGQPQGAILRP